MQFERRCVITPIVIRNKRGFTTGHILNFTAINCDVLKSIFMNSFWRRIAWSAVICSYSYLMNTYVVGGVRKQWQKLTKHQIHDLFSNVFFYFRVFSCNPTGVMIQLFRLKKLSRCAEIKILFASGPGLHVTSESKNTIFSFKPRIG